MKLQCLNTISSVQLCSVQSEYAKVLNELEEMKMHGDASENKYQLLVKEFEVFSKSYSLSINMIYRTKQQITELTAANEHLQSLSQHRDILFRCLRDENLRLISGLKADGSFQSVCSPTNLRQQQFFPHPHQQLAILIRSFCLLTAIRTDCLQTPERRVGSVFASYPAGFGRTNTTSDSIEEGL